MKKAATLSLFLKVSIRVTALIIIPAVRKQFDNYDKVYKIENKLTEKIEASFGDSIHVIGHKRG